MKAVLSILGLGTWGRKLLGVGLGRFYQYPPHPLSVKQLPCLSDHLDLPSISLVTPSYNQVSFIGQTLASVVDQDYPNLHYIIQDAKSSDGTDAVLRSYATRGVDIRIEADHGQADALNRGFACTSGEIMGYLNSDDLLLPGALCLVGCYFRDNPSVDVVYGNRLVVDEDGFEIGRWILPGHDPDVLRFVDYIPQESMFWRRRIWNCVGAKFDISLQFAMDWDLILRFLDAGAVFHHVPELFGIFRAHSGQKSQADFVDLGANEMVKLRLRHGNKHLNCLRRLFLHGRYLYRHRQADATFQAAALS